MVSFLTFRVRLTSLPSLAAVPSACGATTPPAPGVLPAQFASLCAGFSLE
jgi:hypothetical protein